MRIIHFYVNIFIESEALVMTGVVVFVVVVVVVLWFKHPSQHLWSCRDGQLT